MKKILSAIALLFLLVPAGAQSSYMAEFFSRNNYYGTARSMGLGGAMTALGGDLGSVVINPAGSVVNDYSQVEFTPGLIFATSTADYDAIGNGSYQDPTKTTKTALTLPNLGLNLVLFPQYESWITAMSFGFIVNSRANYRNNVTASGTNAYSSYLASMARAAGSISGDNFLQAAFDANQFGAYGAYNRYAGSNEAINPGETYSYIPGTLDQNSVFNTSGYKTDVILNFAMNHGDEFYLGFNLGLPSIKYSCTELFEESAQYPHEFPVYFIDDAGKAVATNYMSSYDEIVSSYKASGVYGSVGFIWLPAGNLRVGASVQTPTIFKFDTWEDYYTASAYQDNRFNGESPARGYDPFGVEDQYQLSTPYIINAGLAYTFGGVALLSADYELTDYSVMRYSSTGGRSSRSFAEVNYINRTFRGVQHSMRAGLEIRPTEAFAIRAGYGFSTSPQKFYWDYNGYRVYADNCEGEGQYLVDGGYVEGTTHQASFGIGYSSAGSFFADLAVRMTWYPVDYNYPYVFGPYESLAKDGTSLGVFDPVVRIKRNVVDAVLTFGWRF